MKNAKSDIRGMVGALQDGIDEHAQGVYQLVDELSDELEAAEKRIAELETRERNLLFEIDALNVRLDSIPNFAD